MIRSGTVNSIHELAAQGKSIHAITVELGLARNTVRKYLRGTSQIVPRPRRKRGSKLDPFKEQIKKWMTIDHCYNCESMFPRLQALGYTGSLSLLRPFVHALRPPAQGQHPVQRYETRPGEQMQFDWAEFKYEQDGVMRKLYGFAAILSYSRMRFVTFVKRCDTPTLLRCFMEACEYFGGLPKAALTDRMKSVILEMDGKVPKWNPVFSDFMASIGMAPRVCKAYTPQTNDLVAYCTPCARLACPLMFVSILLKSMFIGRFKDSHPMVIGPIHGKQTCPSPVHEGLSAHSIGFGGLIGG